MADRITSWSYSRLNKHKNCPAAAKYGYIDKLPDPAGAAAERGTAIHKMAEDFVNDELPALPEELEQFADEFFELRDKYQSITEQQWGFYSNWRRANWFKAWCRMVLDVHRVDDDEIWVCDYKTGKIRGEHEEQLSLYAMGGLLRYPKADVVKVELWYLDHGEIVEDEYERDQLEDLQYTWAEKADKMLSDTTFTPKPGRFPCAWCNYNVNAGGPCESGKPHKMEK